MDTDLDIVIVFRAAILERINHVQHEEQSQASRLPVLGVQIERWPRAGIERPAVVHDPQDDLPALAHNLEVDEVRFVVDVGVTDHVADQFIDGQVDRVGRPVRHVVGLEERPQFGVEALEFSHGIADAQLEPALDDRRRRAGLGRFRPRWRRDRSCTRGCTGAQHPHGFFKPENERQRTIDFRCPEDRLHQPAGIEQDHLVPCSDEPLAAGYQQADPSRGHEIDIR